MGLFGLEICAHYCPAKHDSRARAMLNPVTKFTVFNPYSNPTYSYCSDGTCIDAPPNPARHCRAHLGCCRLVKVTNAVDIDDAQNPRLLRYHYRKSTWEQRRVDGRVSLQHPIYEMNWFTALREDFFAAGEDMFDAERRRIFFENQHRAAQADPNVDPGILARALVDRDEANAAWAHCATYLAELARIWDLWCQVGACTPRPGRHGDPRMSKAELQDPHLFVGFGAFDDGNVRWPANVMVPDDGVLSLTWARFVQRGEQPPGYLLQRHDLPPASLVQPPQVVYPGATTQGSGVLAPGMPRSAYVTPASMHGRAQSWSGDSLPDYESDSTPHRYASRQLQHSANIRTMDEIDRENRDPLFRRVYPNVPERYPGRGTIGWNPSPRSSGGSSSASSKVSPKTLPKQLTIHSDEEENDDADDASDTATPALGLGWLTSHLSFGNRRKPTQHSAKRGSIEEEDGGGGGGDVPRNEERAAARRYNICKGSYQILSSPAKRRRGNDEGEGEDSPPRNRSSARRNALTQDDTPAIQQATLDRTHQDSNYRSSARRDDRPRNGAFCNSVPPNHTCQRPNRQVNSRQSPDQDVQEGQTGSGAEADDELSAEDTIVVATTPALSRRAGRFRPVYRSTASHQRQDADSDAFDPTYRPAHDSNDDDDDEAEDDFQGTMAVAAKAPRATKQSNIHKGKAKQGRRSSPAGGVQRRGRSPAQPTPPAPISVSRSGRPTRAAAAKAMQNIAKQSGAGRKGRKS